MPSVTSDPFASLSDLPGVFEAVDAARASIDGLLREPALRRDRGRVRAAARRESAWASAVLAGADVSSESFDPPFDDTEAGRLCAASLRANADLRTLADTWRHAPLQALARLHTLVATEVTGGDALGRPNPADSGVVGEFNGVETSPTPESRVVASRLTSLAEHVVASSAPGIVVAGIVQAELFDLRPFGWGDGLIARAASRLTLVSRGVDPDALTVPELGLLELGLETYREKLTAYRSGHPGDVGVWLIHFGAAVQQGASASRRIAASPDAGKM